MHSPILTIQSDSNELQNDNFWPQPNQLYEFFTKKLETSKKAPTRGDEIIKDIVFAGVEPGNKSTNINAFQIQPSNEDAPQGASSYGRVGFAAQIHENLRKACTIQGYTCIRRNLSIPLNILKEKLNLGSKKELADRIISACEYYLKVDNFELIIYIANTNNLTPINSININLIPTNLISPKLPPLIERKEQNVDLLDKTININSIPINLNSPKLPPLIERKEQNVNLLDKNDILYWIKYCSWSGEKAPDHFLNKRLRRNAIVIIFTIEELKNMNLENIQYSDIDIPTIGHKPCISYLIHKNNKAACLAFSID